MKLFTKKIFCLTFFSICLSSPVFASGARLPDFPTDGLPTSTGTSGNSSDSTPSTPTPLPTTPTSGAYVDQIKSIAENSSCLTYSWKNRGRAPAGYIRGMALTYARSLCRSQAKTSLGMLLASANEGNTKKDAIAYYASVFAGLPVAINTEGAETLRALYTLGIGLGMRESSGVYCEGWDRSAGSNRPASAGEAGLFQTSYDSLSASAELPKLYSEYKKTKDTRCMLDVFKAGAKCSSLSNLGTGAGADFQAFLKSCPAFATEYAMTTLRVLRSHYGPINRREAEVNSSCNKMLKQVQQLVENDPYACEDLQ